MSNADLTDLGKYGVIVAGNSASKMSKWPVVAFRSFAPEILSHLTVAHLALLSPNQLQAIPTDSWSVVNVTSLVRTVTLF